MHWEFASFLIVCAAGTLLHFAFRWSGKHPAAAAFAAVNESTWEHMKLFYWPYLFCTAAGFVRFGDAFRNYLAVKAAAGLIGILAIPVLHYTLAGMFGPLPDWINICIFYIAAALACLMGYFMLVRGILRSGRLQLIGLLALLSLGLLFVTFTYRTPTLPMFRDPVSGTYGFWGRK